MDMENKIDFLTKRDQDRKLNLEKKRRLKENDTSETEKLSYFEETFNLKRQQIEELINKSVKLETNQLPDHFDDIFKDILILQKYIASSNLFLTSFHIKKYQEILQELSVNVKELEDKLLPKKKFGFKNRKTTKRIVPQKIVGADEIDFRQKIPQTLTGFVDAAHENLEMHGLDVHQKDLSAENLVDCEVKFLGAPSTIHLNNLRNCRIISGPVSTSIFAENCQDCILVIACQQLRLHSSKNIQIYLHVTSRAIMEDCHDIQIAPYNLSYNNLDADFQLAGLNRQINNWMSIDDFNWLNIDRPSPNWRVMDNDNQMKHWII